MQSALRAVRGETTGMKRLPPIRNGIGHRGNNEQV